MDTITTIRTRRTVKRFTGEALDRSRIEALLELATWAPNHRRSQPWRFHACDQATCRTLGERLVTDATLAMVLDPRKMVKIRELLACTGALVLVTWVRNPDPQIDREDLMATAAAVQNLLLAATAAGLGSFWSTNPGLAHATLHRACGMDPDREGFVGAIFLGRSAESPDAPTRVPMTERLLWITPRW